MLAIGIFGVVALAITAAPTRNSAADFTGQEILSVARIAHGGVDYASLQYVTVKATGFVNAVAFGAAGANPLGGMPKSNWESPITRTRRCVAVWKFRPAPRFRDAPISCSPAQPAVA